MIPPLRIRLALGLLLMAAVALPASLLWDFAWESTVGIDRVWAPPHTTTYAAVALGALAAILACGEGLQIGRWRAPLGAWLALWGAVAFVAAFIFDRWWQAAYGLGTGIWHPPQILKAVAFYAVAVGAWLEARRAGGAAAQAVAGGALLALIGGMTLVSNIANRQHAAAFYQIACAIYPAVLTALAVSGRGRFPATSAALVYGLLLGAAVWLLPLVPGSPAVAPIYQHRDHLLPPPFPLLLLLPALAIDLLVRGLPSRGSGWGAALENGLAFFVIFLAVQWPFAAFLLSPSADHWFFAGGGRNWPFFLKIPTSAMTTFWKSTGEELTLTRGLLVATLAVVSAWVGLRAGSWMKAVRR
jgi:hypothetical protein